MGKFLGRGGRRGAECGEVVPETGDSRDPRLLCPERTLGFVCENGHRLYPSLDTTSRSQSPERSVRSNTAAKWTESTYSEGSAISAVPILRKPSRA